MIESAGMSSTDSIISASSSRSASLHGAKVTPQLPSTTDVTPCQHDDEPIGSQASWASRWVWMSTNPGVTMQPSASIVRRPSPSTSPTATTRSPSMATSAGVRRSAGAVDDRAVADDEIVHRGSPWILMCADRVRAARGSCEARTPCPAPTTPEPTGDSTCRSARSTRPTRAPTPPAPSCSGASRYYMDFAAADGSLGGYVRIGRYPNLGVVWYWALRGRPGPAAGHRDRQRGAVRRAATSRSSCAPTDSGPTTTSRPRSTTSPSGSRRSAWRSTTRPRPTGGSGAIARRSGFDLEWDTDGLPVPLARRA